MAIHQTHSIGYDRNGNEVSRCAGCNRATDSPGIDRKCPNPKWVPK